MSRGDGQEAAPANNDVEHNSLGVADELELVAAADPESLFTLDSQTVHAAVDKPTGERGVPNRDPRDWDSKVLAA